MRASFSNEGGLGDNLGLCSVLGSQAFGGCWKKALHRGIWWGVAKSSALESNCKVISLPWAMWDLLGLLGHQVHSCKMGIMIFTS